MNITSYLKELEKELKGLTSEDKQNILAYYNEYLIDAEAEAEGDFEPNAALGSPHTLAAQIRADIAIAPLAQESSATISQSQGQNLPGYQPGQPYQQQTPNNQTPFSQQEQPQTQKKKSDIGIVWAVILGILAIPVGLPLAIALFAVIFAVLVTLFALLLTLGVTALSLFVAGILALLAGIFLLFLSPPVGLFYIGSGLVVLGFFILLAIAFGTLSRLAIRGVAKLFNAIRVKLSRRERAAR